MAYDLLPLVTIAEKQEMLGEALQENHILLFQHDPVTECWHCGGNPKGYQGRSEGQACGLFVTC